MVPGAATRVSTGTQGVRAPRGTAEPGLKAALQDAHAEIAGRIV